MRTRKPWLYWWRKPRVVASTFPTPRSTGAPPTSSPPRTTPPLLLPLIVSLSSPGRGRPSRGLDGRPDLIVNNDGDTTLLIHEGVKAEELFEKTNELLDPNFTDNTLFQIVLTIIKDELKTDPTRYRKMKSISLGFLRKPPLELRGSIRCKRMGLFSFLLLMSITLSPRASLVHLFSRAKESDLLLTPFDEKHLGNNEARYKRYKVGVLQMLEKKMGPESFRRVLENLKI
ncbi:Adenosylhomocysteinase [Glycine soja]